MLNIWIFLIDKIYDNKLVYLENMLAFYQKYYEVS